MDRTKKIYNVNYGTSEHPLFGQNVDDYPKHHFSFAKFNTLDSLWPLQIINGGPDDNIAGVWRQRINSPAFSLEYVMTGEFTFIQHNSEYQCRPGDLFIIQRNVDNYFKCVSPYAKKYTLSMSGNALKSILIILKLDDADVLRIGKSPEIIGIFEQAFALLQNQSSQDGDALSVLAYQILLALSKYRPEIECPELNEILNYIKRNIRSNISAETICSAFHLSQSTFYRLFKKRLAMTPAQYITREKIKLAEIMLAREDLTVKEIAYLLGFNDPLYFSTKFRKYTGKPPLRYRKTHTISRK